MKKLIGIVDYGAGNLQSVVQCFQRLGCHTRVLLDTDSWYGLDAIILPGVGAFSSAMAALQHSGIDEELKSWASEGRPLIGICLGMQLFANDSEEFGLSQGLGLIPGAVRAIGDSQWHIGWNQLEFEDNSPQSLKTFRGADVFFNHSFEFRTSEEFRIARVDVGRELTAIVRKENVIGIQFHPEKSQIAGADVLRALMNEVWNA